MDPTYVVIFSILFLFLFFSYRARKEIKKVGMDNTAAVRENTEAVREHTEILRQYLIQKASGSK
ncbi:hypothetical protein ATY78_11780 [Rhizobium sp. R635]|nr:hypothetical protein ATY78_11780 [Rhizobium sp. R635]